MTEFNRPLSAYEKKAYLKAFLEVMHEFDAIFIKRDGDRIYYDIPKTSRLHGKVDIVSKAIGKAKMAGFVVLVKHL